MSELNELIKRLRDLPKQPQGCQGGVFPWPHLVPDQSGEPLRPVVPLWADLETGGIHAHRFLAPGDDGLRAALLGLGGFVEKMFDNASCPEWIEVRDGELADYLRRHLEGTGIEVQLVEHLDVLEGAFEVMAQLFHTQIPAQQSLLNGAGVTLDQVRAFAEGAAEWYRSAPWRYLAENDVIKIESPRPPRGMTYVVVMGSRHMVYGLAFYPSRAAYYGLMRADSDDNSMRGVAAGLSQVTFEHEGDAMVADTMLWNEHQLPIAGERAHPTAIRYVEEGGIARPNQRELLFLEGVLRALASTTEEEVDSGRWTQTAATFAGTKTFKFSIPDLLDPPSQQEWARRGFPPDRRALERTVVELEREAADRTPKSEKDIDRVKALVVGSLMHAPLPEESSAEDRAQRLCFDAYAIRGRRRVQLARQALELDADCADAYVIWAEHCGTPEEQIARYRRGVEAGARKLGEDFFAENVGRFYDLTSTRPYFRALLGLANRLDAHGEIDEASAHYQELLRLNADDALGIRYLLLPKLIAARRDVEAAQLMKRFDENSAQWAYGRALMAFRLGGRCDAAESTLRLAKEANRHVPDLLCSDTRRPMPLRYKSGSFEEACIVVGLMYPAFAATPEALQWIAES